MKKKRKSAKLSEGTHSKLMKIATERDMTVDELIALMLSRLVRVG